MMIKCLIVEDEYHVAEDLEMMLLQSGEPIEIVARTDTVNKTVEWLRNNTADLIFLDIQLRNSLCFEIFDHVQVTTPVIFTTSYNQYVIKSFEVNNIAYLLKPIDEDDLHTALRKYKQLYYNVHQTVPLPAVNEKVITLHTDYQKRFLVQSGTGIKSIAEEEIAFFRVQKNYVLLTTKDGNQYVFNSSLDTLEQRLDPVNFFRINRQFIVSFNTIDTMYPYSKGRLRVTTSPDSKEIIVVGTEKVHHFKDWLNR